MNIVFMGTPDFAVPCLEELVKSEHKVCGVFTQPDKPKNRGQKMQFSPVKECAVKYDIPVYQPLSLRKGEDAEKSMEILKELNPDCIVVAAYGQILPKSVLDLPKFGCINVHASLLPRYRGAAPIQHCIIDGEKVTGITIMYMAEGLDTGDMILKEEVEIHDRMTASELHDRFTEISGPFSAGKGHCRKNPPDRRKYLLRFHDFQGDVQNRLYKICRSCLQLYPRYVCKSLRIYNAG